MIDNVQVHEWSTGDLKPVEMPEPVKPMVNPHMLVAGSKRWNDARFAGGKIYYAVLKAGGVILRARRIWKRASEAEAYAGRLKARWERLYDAAIVAMTGSLPENS